MRRLFGIFAIILATGCSLVDEDMSGCPDELKVDYEMHLVTNIQMEIGTELKLASDVHVATALTNNLKSIFSDHAHDVDLSFYDVVTPMPSLGHFTDIIDANQASYTLNIPAREYMHLAVANIKNNDVVSLHDETYCKSSRLVQKKGDGDPEVIDSHTTGIFTARHPMTVLDNKDESFNVNLYMANCATALVLDNTAEGTPKIKDFKAFSTGFASSFNIADSSYVFDSSPLVRANTIPVEGDAENLYVTVQFPSRDPNPKSKVVIETTDPFDSDYEKEVLWEWVVYVTLEDDTVTENRLAFSQPLRAGELRVVRVRILPDGTLSTDDTSVGVSVTLDWKQGGSHDVPL